jgi:crotonobetainyl-CoA:carnitine CoA-transferase CaiB-like acyl-CoA transferase
VDLATALAGPYCATLLGDLGADVIKVEKPRRGDLTRFSDQFVRGQSGYFIGVNRNKRGLTADLRTPEGQQIVRRLSASADVLIQNFRGGRMREWGLSFEELSAINPKLIYCSISAYGPLTQGFEQAIGNDLTGQGYSGLMDLTGEANGPPQRVGASITDVAASFQATIAILAALVRRGITGAARAECIHVSLIESAFALMPNLTTSILNSDATFTRSGSGHPQFVPYKAFTCSDGKYLLLGSFHKRSWQALCDSIGLPELVTDPRFRENTDRVANRDTVDKLIGDRIALRPRVEWLSLLQSRDVPCAPVLTLRDSLAMFAPAIAGLIVEQQHAAVGTVRMLRPAFQFIVEPVEPRGDAAPTLGQHTDQILSEVGYEPAEIARLHQSGII